MRVCKSPALGGRAIVCTSCDHHHYIYNSCGHSHCPICQTIKREQWIDRLKNELLNVPYVHMVFTLPRELHTLARHNKSVFYGMMLKIPWLTVKLLSEKKSNIGGLPGMINVLHTFGSDMKYHIHTHCMVTFGGLDSDNIWQYPKRKDKIAKYRTINKTYRDIFIEHLEDAYASGRIGYEGDFEALITAVSAKDWVVHNTKPTLDTEILENYLARYINRVAISKSRVKYIKETSEVLILYNDYKNQEEGKAAPKKHKKLDPLSFIHQFVQHILPLYFHKSRRYGLHASAIKKKYKDTLPESIRRNGSTIRTIMQILTQLIKETPFECTNCKSKEYEIKLVQKDKEWIHRYIKVPTTRPPPPKIKPHIGRPY